jgi:hypothetical protein
VVHAIGDVCDRSISRHLDAVGGIKGCPCADPIKGSRRPISSYSVDQRRARGCVCDHADAITGGNFSDVQCAEKIGSQARRERKPGGRDAPISRRARTVSSKCTDNTGRHIDSADAMVRLISDIYNSRGKLDAVSRNIEPAGYPLSESSTRIAPPSNRCDSPGECHAAN